MFQIKRVKYILSLMFLGTMLCSCSIKANYNNCPRYPVGGKPVYEELKSIPYEGYEDFWEWVGRVNKLREELELCLKDQ